MSVIGRLDEQVDRVLISPLGQEATKAAHVSGPHTGDEEVPADAPPLSAGKEIRTARGAGRGELPVWLL